MVSPAGWRSSASARTRSLAALLAARRFPRPLWGAARLRPDARRGGRRTLWARRRAERAGGRGGRGGGGADCRGCVDRRALVAPRAPDGAVNVRRLVVFLHDLVAAALAWMAAYWLR